MKKIYIILLLIVFMVISCSKEKETKNENKTGCGITGTIVYQGTPTNWAYAYLYPTKDTGFRQEFAQASEPTGTDGKFTIKINPGKYYLTARKRWNYAKVGALRTGDFTIDYFNNPVELKDNQYLDIGEIELNEIIEEGENIPSGCGITGKAIITDINKSDDVYIYIYNNELTDLRGPSYYITKKVKKDGSFKINLLPGKYYVVARKRSTGSKLGPLDEEDYNYAYLQNPIEIIQDKYLDLTEMRLKKIDIKKLNAVKNGTVKHKNKSSIGIRGIITNKKGEKVENVYAFIYKDSQMVGKPLYRSIPTQKNGKYEISINEGGIYYVGARNTFGGPLEPGDLVGTYNGTSDHLVKLKSDEIIENINIVVEEFQ